MRTTRADRTRDGSAIYVMALYTFRCPKHGDFQVEQPMAETTREVLCWRPLHEPVELETIECCGEVAPKVLGSRLQFTYGKAAFHDGPEGTGETVRETSERWRREHKQEHGVEPIPANSRWV